MVTTRGMGYFIPYQYEFVPKQTIKCSPRLNFLVSFQNKRCTATRGLYAHAAAKCKQGKEPQGIFNQTVRPADTNFWVSNQYTHGQGMKVLQNKAMGKDQQFTSGASKSLQHLGKIGRIWQVSLQKVVVSTINACSLCLMGWLTNIWNIEKDLEITWNNSIQSTQPRIQSTIQSTSITSSSNLPDLAWCLQGFDQWAGSPTCRMHHIFPGKQPGNQAA